MATPASPAGIRLFQWVHPLKLSPKREPTANTSAAESKTRFVQSFRKLAVPSSKIIHMTSDSIIAERKPANIESILPGLRTRSAN